jgi:hypothetical protein
MPTKKKTAPRNTPAVFVVPGLCPTCGSTDRTPYRGCNVQEFGGTTPDGQPFTHIVRKYTTCTACGQVRVDMIHENRTAKNPKRPKKPESADVSTEAAST